MTFLNTLEEGSRIIVFCTDSCLKYLRSSKIWYGDGTFSITPQHFYQFYTIHGIVMGQLVPLNCRRILCETTT